MIEWRSGDIMTSRAAILVNPVNCVGVMGKGLAAEFRRAYPIMFDDYVARCERGEVVPGRPYVFKVHSERWIINLPTKQHWRGRSRIEWIRDGLPRVLLAAEGLSARTLALPPVGCGLGGLDWSLVRPIVEKVFGDSNIDVEVWRPSQAPPASLGQNCEAVIHQTELF